MRQDKARPFRVPGEPGPGKAPVIFRAMTACNCGCGLKARFEFSVGCGMLLIDDPAAVLALIAEMKAGYELLWPGGGDGDGGKDQDEQGRPGEDRGLEAGQGDGQRQDEDSRTAAADA